MIRKENMYIISSDVDDSVKAFTSSQEITIFNSYVEFEKTVNQLPTDVATLIISCKELAFTNVNMERVISILNSPFVKVDNVVYLLDKTTDIKVVNQFLLDAGLLNWQAYQTGDIDFKYISEIVSGEGRRSETNTEVIQVFRMRASEYIEQQRALKYQTTNSYTTDEDILSSMTDVEEPEDIRISRNTELEIKNIAGLDSPERTLFAFIVSQYLAIYGRTLILERDYEYHTLSDYVFKSGVPCVTHDISELFDDFKSVIGQIKNNNNRLTVITAKRKFEYNYDFIAALLESNLQYDMQYFVKEQHVRQIVHSTPTTVVMKNTVPDILRTCKEAVTALDVNQCTFVGLNTSDLNEILVYTNEMIPIIEAVLCIQGAKAQVFKMEGLHLGKGALHDIRSIFR